MDGVRVFRGAWGAAERDGPFAGVRDGSLLAYTLHLTTEFVPRPGHDRTEIVLVDLELGVSMSRPSWQWRVNPDGSRTGGIDAGLAEPATWYVDLVSTKTDHERIDVLDLFIDLMVATDGRQARLLDLDEYAAALGSGLLTPAQAADGLRRWQRFLDTYVHADREPRHGFADFPPARFADLVAELGA